GQGEAAVLGADRVIEELRVMGTTGLNLGLAHETRARVALLLNDRPAFEAHAAFFGATFDKAANPALASKAQTLLRDGRRRAGIGGGGAGVSGEHSIMNSRALSALSTCHDSIERAQCILQSLAEVSGSKEGYLFLIGADGL